MSAHHHPDFTPPRPLTVEECVTFYDIPGLALCDRCNNAAGVQDHAIPIWDAEPVWLCETCAWEGEA